MGLALWVGEQAFPVGSPSFLKAFFSTVYLRLEKRWGDKYPAIMNDLYAGRLTPQQCEQAIAELSDIRLGLANFSPDQVVWDFENPSVAPPWGNRISSTITSLANYFWTSDGKNLMEVLLVALKQCEDSQMDLYIR